MVNSLKKLLMLYHIFIPFFDTLSETFGLLHQFSNLPQKVLEAESSSTVDCFTVRQITIVKIDDCSEPLVTCFIPLLALADNNTSCCKQMCIEISLFIYRIAERIPSLSVCLFVF